MCYGLTKGHFKLCFSVRPSFAHVPSVCYCVSLAPTVSLSDPVLVRSKFADLVPSILIGFGKKYNLCHFSFALLCRLSSLLHSTLSLTDAIAPSLTSSFNDVLVLQYAVLFSGTNYSEWVPCMSLYIRGLRI
jgi:hypothetical protein